MRLYLIVAVTLTLSLVAAPHAIGQPQLRPGVFLSPEDAGPDYQIQGEYKGPLLESENSAITWGLQVIAVGDGAFEAVLLQGGLPGDGWYSQTRIKLASKPGSNQVTLAGEQHDRTYRFDGEWFTAYNSAGEQLGRLEKVHRVSPSMGMAPPPGAVVLFGGAETEELEGEAVVDNGLLKQGFMTKEPVGDFRLHIEFRTPFMPKFRGQQRGNSGVYIQRRYEVQILDSFGLDGVKNESGALYRQRAPEVNMALPPLQWQTYDIHFRAARFKDGKRTENARITVLHNGVAVQDDVKIANKTGAGRQEGPNPLPILFQDHRDQVRFRNMWIVRDNIGQPEQMVAEVKGHSATAPQFASSFDANTQPELSTVCNTVDTCATAVAAPASSCCTATVQQAPSCTPATCCPKKKTRRCWQIFRR